MSKYTIIAGDEKRPTFVTAQYLEKKSGQTLTEQGTVAQNINLRRQEIGVPNYTMAWGVRLDENGKIPSPAIDIKDPKYKGLIKFLKWGDKTGCLISCRFLKGYNTLDRQYQNIVLNAQSTIDENDPSSSEAHFLTLLSGENEFDADTNPHLVDMLKIHAYNQDSVCKNPEAINWLFREKNDEVRIEKEEIILNAKTDALFIVKGAAEDNSGKKLKNLLGVVRRLVAEEPEEKHLYGFLQRLADSNPDAFLTEINTYKMEVSNIFEKAKSYNVLDLTKDGHIAAGKEKKELIVSDVPGKGEDMLEWVLTNYLEPRSFEAIFQLKKITDKLK